MSKKRSLISGIQTFMDSPKGRTYLNYVYSWGAAIVILGTLFKLTHIAGANLMLFIGMGAEVVVFFFSAFERPYELAEEDRKEERAERRAELEATGGSTVIIGGSSTAQPEASGVVAGAPVAGGTVIIGGSGGGSAIGAGADPELVSEMDDVTKEYVEKVRSLNEAIKRIAEQSESLGRNMQEMDTLARNITAMNAMYELQLRNAGNQVGNTELVNEETRKMAEQIKELNAMYTRMLEAMTINMSRQQ